MDMTGRHRRRRGGGSIGAAAAAVAVILTIGLGWTGFRLLGTRSCTPVTVRVAAAAEIAPEVRNAATAWASTGTERGCVTVEVIPTDPAAVAAATARQQGAVVAGIDAADTRTRVPDVWIPDSSTWLTRLRSAGTGLVPPDATSVAESPVVLAVSHPVAAQLGWVTGTLPWSALLTAMNSASPIKAGIVAPDRDAASLTTLLRLAAVAATAGQSGQGTTVAVLRALAANHSTVRADLLARFPRSTDAGTLAASLAAAPLPEQAVLAFNAVGPPVPLDAIPLTPAPDALDYPYAVMPGVSPAVRTAANRLAAALSGPAFRDRLAQVGLRAPDGSTGAGFTGTAVTAAAGASIVEPELIDQTLSTWGTITRPGRMLAVIDVSGSMLTPVPTAGGATREQVTVKAAAGGLTLFDDAWSVGLWVFATNMDGNRPYQELVPIVPVGQQRAQLRAGLERVAAKPQGNTALYETLLAAYRSVQAGWDPARVNSIVMITDGMDDNPGGMSLAQLTAQLHQIVDPARPVEIIVLGIGNQVPRDQIQKITDITGGGVFIASDPATIGRIFLQAIALRPAAGN